MFCVRLGAYIAGMALKPETLLSPKPQGLYCAAGDFFIDPVRPVDRAVITHGHSDHARAGHGVVLATQPTLDIMQVRYGEDFAGQVHYLIEGGWTWPAKPRHSAPA